MKLKTLNNSYKLLSIAITFLILTSCSEDFTNRPPEDSISLDGYYKTNSQVTSATNGMYSRTWFNFANKFFWVLEIGSGNMLSLSPDVAGLRTFSLNGSDPELANAWKSLWSNVAQSNVLINYLESRVGSDVDQNVIDNTLGEAYFMRATSYFYLVRMWGAVPIIENNVDYVNDPYINTNPEADVYKFIINDYKLAIEKLEEKTRGTNYGNNGRVSKGSAKSMLAKVYLYQKDYTNARAMAEEVINSSEFKLLDDFGDLFLYKNNNNEESIFALQWKGDGNYGSANNSNTQFGIASATVSTSNASYGGVMGPSRDVMALYSSDDLRRHETVMLPGDTYPDIMTSNGLGFTVPNEDNAQSSGGGIKKYCIGRVTDATGPVDAWNMMDNNQYIMRYAELLLIHAEAVLAGNASTSDASALSSFNAVRNRAGLSSKTSITFEDIFKERRLELCFEGDYWFDLGRIDKDDAIAIMSAQNRGTTYNAEYFTPIYSATDREANDFILKYPDNEVAKNPKLNQAPVPYTF